eukprot:g17014.t1
MGLRPVEAHPQMDVCFSSVRACARVTLGEMVGGGGTGFLQRYVGTTWGWTECPVTDAASKVVETAQRETAEAVAVPLVGSLPQGVELDEHSRPNSIRGAGRLT